MSETKRFKVQCEADSGCMNMYIIEADEFCVDSSNNLILTKGTETEDVAIFRSGYWNSVTEEPLETLEP